MFIIFVNTVHFKFYSIHKLILIFISIFILGSELSIAQKKLIGISADKMYEINHLTGKATYLRTLSSNFTGCASLVFLPHQQKFYTYSRVSNILISIDIKGNIDTLGAISIPGETIYSIESIAYHESDCGIYVSASLNGGSAQKDWAAESIVYVDVETLKGTLLTEYKSNAPKGGDADVMCFWNDTLFLADADNTQYFYFHKTTLRNFPASITPPQVYYEKKYYTIGDLVEWDDVIYFPADYKLYKFDPQDVPININTIGTTHSPTDGPMFYMMGLFDPEQPKFELRDTVVCDTSKLQFRVPGGVKNILWSTGETSNTINITETGFYHVSFNVNDCQWLSDTAYVEVLDCDSCKKKAILYKDSISLGNDTTVCDGKPFLISLNIEQAEKHVWGNGTTGNQIWADRNGNYFVRFWIGDCQFTSDTINITFIKCDSSEIIRNEALSGINFEANRIICTNDSVYESIANAPGFIQWSDGNTNRNRFFNTTGQYWAQFDTAGYQFNSDTFSITETSCNLCDYYIPNAFSPNNDQLNPVFSVWFNPEECQPEIEMMIFNRWGEKLYEGIDNKWDGMYDGKPCQVDVYIYVIKMKYDYQGNPVKIEKSGNVHLMR